MSDSSCNGTGSRAIKLPSTEQAHGSRNGSALGWGTLSEYFIDSAQRTILFWDALRQRSEQYYAEKSKPVPHVLHFDAELLLDARTFARPVNYLLVRIKPPEGTAVDVRKRPFVVVDPRAGHGPGIGELSDTRAAEAIELFVYQVSRQLGSLAAALGGLDALVFTGGIGEHSAVIRARICRQAAWLGLEFDAAANEAGGPRLSASASCVSAWVIPTNEELMIAQHTSRLVGQSAD